MLAKFIQDQRKKNNLTQEYMASKLGISRPTYAQIEKGERDLTIPEAQRLVELFDTTLENFLAERVESLPVVDIKKGPKRKSSKKQEVRINVPQEKAQKFKQALLYILRKVGGKPNIGQTVLYKLLYFIDFDYYEKYEEQLMGARYIKNTYGPTPLIFTKIISELEAKNQIETVKSKYYQHEQKKYLVNPAVDLDLSALTAQELAHIDWEIDRLSEMTATKISALSHLDTPWVVAKDKEALEYEHVFYRTDDTSVRTYEAL